MRYERAFQLKNSAQPAFAAGPLRAAMGRDLPAIVLRFSQRPPMPAVEAPPTTASPASPFHRESTLTMGSAFYPQALPTAAAHRQENDDTCLDSNRR
jgi:hypothetical protein